MTERERFIAVLEGKKISGRVPHFELEFFLTMEAFGRVHPSQRRYDQWIQMSEKERQLHRKDIADIHIQIAETFEWSAIFLHPNPWSPEECIRLAEIIREKTNDKYFLLVDGDATFAIPSGQELADFVYWIYENMEEVKQKAQEKVDSWIKGAEKMAKSGIIDGIVMTSDYCFNSGPFLSPDVFDIVITPYLKKQISAYRDLGFYTIKHTDGNIMPILDSLLECNPHALHSLDPQAGIDMKEIKRRVGDKLTLIGNVNCGLLDTGTDEECVESARYALEHGMPGGRYIFSTSNCIYTGMNLDRYKLILDIWKKEGYYE